MDMAPMFDVAGWFASGPGVFRRVGAVLLGGQAVREPIRQVAVLKDAFAQADPEIATLLGDFVRAVGTAIPQPSEVTIAPEGFDPWREAFRIVQAREIWKIYGPFITARKPRLGPGIKERLEFASTVSESDAETARQAQVRAREQIRGMVKPGTILALPTAPCIAPLTTTPGAELESFRLRTMRLTCLAGISGLPQVTIPAGLVSGCPAGLSFIGWAGGDEALLDLAVSLARFVGATSP
jgi:amidase